MKMKQLLTGLAALVAIIPAAFAQDSTGTVNINGSVANRCLFTTPGATISLGEISLGGTGTTAGRLDVTKVNGQTATLVGWCNGTPATMTVQANELLNTGTAASGFTNRVDYTATALANAVNATDSTLVAGPGTASNVGQFTGNVLVTLSASSAPGNGLLIAGSYNGTVVVTLSPNVAL